MKPESEEYAMTGSDRRENSRLAAEFNRPDVLECIKVTRDVPVAFDLTTLYLHDKVVQTLFANSQTIQFVKHWPPTFLRNFLIFLLRKTLMIWDGILAFPAIRREVLA